jgi:hypothetical protein
MVAVVAVAVAMVAVAVMTVCCCSPHYGNALITMVVVDRRDRGRAVTRRRKRR